MAMIPKKMIKPFFMIPVYSAGDKSVKLKQRPYLKIQCFHRPKYGVLPIYSNIERWFARDYQGGRFGRLRDVLLNAAE